MVVLDLIYSYYGLNDSDDVENVYIGDFTIDENPENIIDINYERSRIIKKIIEELENSLCNEKDSVVIGKTNEAIRKAKVIKPDTYSEYIQLVCDRERILISDKNELDELRDKERRLELQERKDNEEYNYTQYKTHFSEKIRETENYIRSSESYIRDFDDSFDGYLSHIRSWGEESSYKFFLKPLQAKLPLGARKKHTYVVAQTGSGKSELLKMLVHGDIEAKNRAVVIIDPHGDMVEEIARFRHFSPSKNYNDLVYIDPTLKDGFSPSINPFEIEDTSEINIATTTQELRRVLSALLSGAGTTAQMEAILSPCIAVLLRKKGSCFDDLQRFMDDEKNEDLIKLGQRSPNPQHAKLFKDKFNSKGYEATKHGIYTRIQTLLNDPIFQNLLSNKTTVNLKELIEQKKTILFKLSLGEGGSESMEAFGRFVVGMLRIIAIQRSKIPIENRTSTFFYIDEFQNFVSEDIEKALTQLRKYGLHLVLANQYVGQNIDTSLQKALFSSGVKIIGKNEMKTAKAAGSEIGVPNEDIKSLKVGEFYLQSESYPALKIKVPSVLLGNNNSMSNEEWEQVEAHNLGLYYKKTGIKEEAPIQRKSRHSKAPIIAPKFEI